MVFIDRFTPTEYQDKNEFNKHVLTERYNTAKALRESYSHMYQEMTNLRNNLQDYKGEQENHPELQMSEEDRIRYNNMIEDRYLALKSIQENTTYPSEYGHTVRPFFENEAGEQIRLSCHYMISGSRHLKQYHLGRTSCMKIDEEMRDGDELYDYNSTIDYISNSAQTIEINTITQTNQAVLTTRSEHKLKKGQKIFIGGIPEDSMINVNNQRFKVGEIISKTEFYLEDNNGNKINSSIFKEYDCFSAGYVLPDPESSYSGFNLVKTISKDREKALVTTQVNHHLRDGDYIKIRGVIDQHNELIQSTPVKIKEQTKILKDELTTFEITTPDEYILQDSFKVGDTIWLSDTNSNVDRSFLNNVGVIEYISTPNSIIFNEPIYQTAALNNYVFSSSLQSKDSVAQISRCSREGSNSIYVNYISQIPDNSYLVAKARDSSVPKIIGVSKCSYFSCTKASFVCNLEPGETNYVATTKDLSSRLVEGTIIYSSNSCNSWVARVVSINGDTRKDGNLKLENLSKYNLRHCPIYLAKVELHQVVADNLNQRDLVFILKSPHCDMKLKTNVNSQHTYLTVSDNPKIFKNGDYIFSVNPKSNIYNGIIFYHGIKANHSNSFKFKVKGNHNITISSLTNLYKGDNLGTVLNDKVYQIVYNDNKSFYLLDYDKKFVSTEFLSSAYNQKDDIGNGIIENILKFNYKKFYINKLDAINEKLTYGDKCKNFIFENNYVKDQKVLEGHIYLIPKMNNKNLLDGRQSASVLSRNVNNCENIISILANNCNTCERALNRISEIAKMLKIQIDYD
jgi:hypothetical protein